MNFKNIQGQRTSSRLLELILRALGFETPEGRHPGFNVGSKAVNTPSGELVGCYGTEHHRYK